MGDEFDEDCQHCGGDGFILQDCFDDTCCCADPEASHGYLPCQFCTVLVPREGGRQ